MNGFLFLRNLIETKIKKMRQKNKMGKLISLFLDMALLVSVAGLARAEEKNFVEPVPNTSFETLKVEGDPGWGNNEATKAGNANCADYYRFQSVQVQMGAAKENFAPGEKITFRGNLVNENSYPIVDGYVVARVGRVNENVGEGNNIIDEFFALEKVALDAKETRRAEFDWTVPKDIPGGKYQVDYFFSVGKKFNLGGLPFSNEVIIGFSTLNVDAGNKASLSFDRSKTQVNGAKYNHIGNWPVFAKGEKVTVTQPIKNTFSEVKKTDVTYDLFYWDSLDEADKIATKTEQVTVAGNGSNNLSYAIDQMNDPVYLLRITAVSGEQKTIVKIRLASEQERPRINYPAITAFPMKEKEAFTLFSCFHNTSNIKTEGRVVVTLTDKSGKEVGKLNYSGVIPSSMSASKEELVAGKNYSYLKLNAQVFDKAGKEADHYETIYDCAELKSEKCRALETTKEVTDGSTVVESVNKFKLALTLGGIFLLLSLAVIIYKKRGGSGRGTAALVIFLALTAYSFFGTEKASAIYNQQNPGTSGTYNQYWFNYCNKMTAGDQDIRLANTSNLTVVHPIGMTSGNTSVSPGTTIGFAQGDSFGGFAALGGLWDTPFMFEVPFWNAPLPFTLPDTNSFVHLGRNGYDNPTGNPVYVAWAFVKPGFSLTSSNPAVVSCSGATCTSVASGTARITATLGRTVVVPWTYIYFNEEKGFLFNPREATYGHRICGGDDRSCAGNCYTGGDISWASLPGTTTFWDINVGTTVSMGCTGTPPINADFCIGDDSGFTGNVLSHAVSACTDDGNPATNTDKCEYACNSTSHYDPVSKNCVVNVCNPVPANPDPQGKAVQVSGDFINLPSDNIFKKLVLSDTAAKCEYSCNSPYSYFLQGCSGSPCCLIPATCSGCGNWSACSQSCGGGTQARVCNAPDSTNTCANSTETQNCNTQACPDNYREVTPS